MSLNVERFIDSPIGQLRLVASDVALLAVHFPVETNATPHLPAEPAPRRHPILDHAAREIDEYFVAGRRDFTVPLTPRGTDFQRAVWQALRAIPYGATCSYADVARAIGRPSAVRAVGGANGLNPIPILVPCHRVIGADGSLTGFGGGLPTKRWLLAHEQQECLTQLDLPL